MYGGRIQLQDFPEFLMTSSKNPSKCCKQQKLNTISIRTLNENKGQLKSNLVVIFLYNEAGLKKA